MVFNYSLLSRNWKFAQASVFLSHVRIKDRTERNQQINTADPCLFKTNKNAVSAQLIKVFFSFGRAENFQLVLHHILLCFMFAFIFIHSSLSPLFALSALHPFHDFFFRSEFPDSSSHSCSSCCWCPQRNERPQSELSHQSQVQQKLTHVQAEFVYILISSGFYFFVCFLFFSFQVHHKNCGQVWNPQRDWGEPKGIHFLSMFDLLFSFLDTSDIFDDISSDVLWPISSNFDLIFLFFYYSEKGFFCHELYHIRKINGL